MSKHDFPFMFISGPCVIENEEKTIEIASKLKEMTSAYDVDAFNQRTNRITFDRQRIPNFREYVHESLPPTSAPRLSQISPKHCHPAASRFRTT